MADATKAQIKVGLAALELAPKALIKQSATVIKKNMDIIHASNQTCPTSVWLTLCVKVGCEHVEHERFSEFVSVFRPWKLSEDQSTMTTAQPMISQLASIDVKTNEVKEMLTSKFRDLFYSDKLNRLFKLPTTAPVIAFVG